jgi:glutamate carboxypeptidase
MSEIAKAVDDAFEREQVPFLQRLVDTPSHTWAPDDVELAALILDEAAADLGLSCRRVADAEGRFADHRVYETPAAGDAPCLALVGHVDTVFPKSLGFLEFKREGDTIYGPGTLDMKSGLSEILWALHAVRRVDAEAFARLAVRFICVSDEEVGSPSSRGLYDELAPKLSSALVFEAGRAEDKIVTCRKGSGMWRVRATGTAAHAGLKHREGVNAIHALSLVIPAIEAITDYERGLTANVGLIEGGTAKNTVPDSAECVVDIRFERLADVEEVERFFERLTQEGLAAIVEAPSPERLASARLSVEGGVSRPPMEASEETQALRLRYEKHAADAGIRVGEAPLQGGGSDANLLAARGVPCIDGLGPWGKHFHKVEEFSSLDSLRARTRALATFLLEEAALAAST